jgi:hypothetical protein
MNESDLAITLADALTEFADNQIAAGRESMHGFDDNGAEIETYEDAGILSRDAGLVIRIAGKKFYVTISRN